MYPVTECISRVFTRTHVSCGFTCAFGHHLTEIVSRTLQCNPLRSVSRKVESAVLLPNHRIRRRNNGDPGGTFSDEMWSLNVEGVDESDMLHEAAGDAKVDKSSSISLLLIALAVVAVSCGVGT